MGSGNQLGTLPTLGKLRWEGGDLDGDHLIYIVSERAPSAYLVMLREKGVSYVVSGKAKVDLAAALDHLAENFGIRTPLLEEEATVMADSWKPS